MIEDVIDYGKLNEERKTETAAAWSRELRYLKDVMTVVGHKLPDGVVATAITSDEQWLAMRGNDVTASVAGALLGVYPYASALDLYEEKAGITVPDFEMTEAMERGIEMEPVAVKRLAKMHPDWTVWRPNTYFSHPGKRMGATPDCFAVDPTRPGFGSIQIKNVEPSIFAKTWRIDDVIEPPLWIVIQALVERELTGASWCAVAVLVIGRGIKLHIIPLEPHEPIIRRIEGEVAEFWHRVENRRPYDPDPVRDYDKLLALYRPREGRVVDLTADNALPEMAAEHVRLRKEVSKAERRLKELKARFVLALGDAEYARLANGWGIGGRRSERKGYVVEPSEVLTIKIKEPKE